MCCTRLAKNTRRKKTPSRHHRTNLSGYIFTTKACIDNRKNVVKQQYLLHMSSQYGELRLTNGWDPFGTPRQISTGFASSLRCCTDVAQRRSTRLCRMFGCLLGWYTIHLWGLLPPNGILPAAKLTLRPQVCIFLYCHRYCTALEQRPSAEL